MCWFLSLSFFFRLYFYYILNSYGVGLQVRLFLEVSLIAHLLSEILIFTRDNLFEIRAEERNQKKSDERKSEIRFHVQFIAGLRCVFVCVCVSVRRSECSIKLSVYNFHQFMGQLLFPYHHSTQ